MLYAAFPLWWALGLAQLIFFVAAAAMAVILYRQRTLVVPRGFGDLAAVPRLDAGRCLRGPGDRAGHRPRRRDRALRRLPGVGRLVPRHHRRDALRRQHRPSGTHPADRPPPGLDVRGHHRVRGARRPGPHPGVQVGDGAGHAQGPDGEQLRPHPGAPVAVVHERLPRLRAGPTDGSVPLLQRLGQQPRDVPAVLRPGLVRPRRRLAPDGGPVRAGGGRGPRSPSPSTADCGAGSRWRPRTPPSGSP